jgi:L-fuculose-phosphate aldolase
MKNYKRRERRLRKEIISINQACVEHGLIRSSDGNISTRLDNELFLITPSGMYKKRLKPKHLLIVNWEGDKLKGKRDLKPTSEILMHLEAYRQRDDIRAVLHAHPPYSTALTIAGIPFPSEIIPEVLITLKEVPTIPYATPGTLDLALSIREPIKTHNAILLKNHGSLTVGETLEDALIALERLEHAANLYYLAHNLGEVIPLPDAEVQKLKASGEQVRS